MPPDWSLPMNGLYADDCFSNFQHIQGYMEYMHANEPTFLQPVGC